VDIVDMDHVEFYVEDAGRLAVYLCEAFGFRCRGQGGPDSGLPDQCSLLLGHGDIRLVLTSGLTPQHPAARFVRRHGDGVACVGLRTGDAGQAFDRAVRAGAVPVAEPRSWRGDGGGVVTAAVSGPGDLTHRLVQRPDGTGGLLPGMVEMVDSEQESDLLHEVDHIALCVGASDLDGTVELYRRAFQLREIFQERIEVGRQAMNSKVVQSTSRGVTFTVIAPDPTAEPGQIDDFLESYAGSGVQHLALATDDIVGAVATLAGRGVRFLTTPGRYYDAIEQRLGRVGVPVAALRAGQHPDGPGPPRRPVPDLHRVDVRPPHVLLRTHRAPRRPHVRHQQHQGAVRGEGARTQRPAGPLLRKGREEK
jgi:4-hydroxymandelate synthase